MTYGAGLAVAAALAYAFNALMGRRLTASDFGTFGALLAGMLALSGPTTALFGGAAMAAARSGRIARPRWRPPVLGCVAGATVVALLPIRVVPKATAWFVVAAGMWMLVSWNRGLLTGLGRIGLVGGSVVFEAVARVGLAVLLVARGWRVAGAAGGLALGIAAAVLLTEWLLPSGRDDPNGRIGSDVWLAVVGLFFLSLVQFADVVAVRLFDPHGAGGYNAASSLARIALYAQAPAAAYALRRTAVAGLRRSLRRALLLGLAPAVVAAGALELFPRRILQVTYGGRYLDSIHLLRVLTVAMLVSGAALVMVSALMGAGRSAWAWSMALAATGGLAAVLGASGSTGSVALAMLAAQSAVLVVAGFHCLRLLGAERGSDGGVLFLNWRDTGHPQGGGSEVFVEEVARRLAAAGRPVTVFCAAYPGAPAEEMRHGIRFVRKGSWRTVYLWAALYHLSGRFGRHQVIVDVQNAVPFFSPLYCGRPVVVLVHHLHLEQWRMIFGPRAARAGWWVESRLAPWVYRRATYVTVSEGSKHDLVELGVDPPRITVVRNGTPTTAGDAAAKTDRLTLTYLGRLVPHKRVELLLDAAATLRHEFPGLRVRIVGKGPWERRLRQTASDLGLTERVSFEGFLDAPEKDRALAQSWAVVLPSVREGWGLAVMEAATVGTPAVGFRVGGLSESVVDGETGLLADRYANFVDSLRILLRSEDLRARLGDAARERALRFGWDQTASDLSAVLDGAVRGRVAEPAPVQAGTEMEPALGIR
jgi:glycosyltransferase involved in cell wall biosynthesis